MGSFLEWLQSQGLRTETAQAVIDKLGIKNEKVLRVCTESDSLRTELLSLAKEKFQFVTYADFCKFVNSFLKPQVVQLAGSSLLGSLFVNLDNVIRELSSFCQTFVGFQNVQLENVPGLCGIGFTDVCTPRSQDGFRPKSGEGDLEEGNDFQMDIPQNLWKSSVQIKESDDSSTQESSSASPRVDPDCSCDTSHSEQHFACVPEARDLYIPAALCHPRSRLPHCSACESVLSVPYWEESRGPIGEIRSRWTLTVKKSLKKQPPDQHSLPLKYKCMSDRNSTNIKLTKHKKILERRIRYRYHGRRMDFASLSNVKRPMRILIGERKHKCSVCRKAFSQSNLKTRMKAHIGERPYKCSICDKDFNYIQSLNIHSTTHTGDHTHKCSICDKGFSYKSNLNKHMKVHTGERPHNCSVCDKGFSQKGHLNRHMKVHTGEFPYKCSICDKNFKYKQSLNEHSTTHTGERPHKCSICDKSFSDKGHLNKHMKVHTGERPYKCSDCDKRFSHKGNLNRHMKIHTGERPYKCSVCDNCFSQKGHLIQHMKVHIGNCPYKCSTCNKGFYAKDNLKTHMKVHAGERPYKCSICDKCFTHKAKLKTHLKVHAGVRPYKCSICDKDFIYKQSLNIHSTTHTGEHPHKCSICHKGFSHKSNLNRHMKVHTGECP